MSLGGPSLLSSYVLVLDPSTSIVLLSKRQGIEGFVRILWGNPALATCESPSPSSSPAANVEPTANSQQPT